MGNEQLTKCCEPLQKLRVRLWPCKKVQVGKDQGKAQSYLILNIKTGLIPLFQGDTSVVVLIILYLCAAFLSFAPCVRFRKFRWVGVTVRPPIEKYLLPRLTVFSLSIST